MINILENAYDDFLVWFPTQYVTIVSNGRIRRKVGVRWSEVWRRFKNYHFGKYTRGLDRGYDLREKIKHTYKTEKDGCGYLIIVGYESI
jgi:hypothetical protein